MFTKKINLRLEKIKMNQVREQWLAQELRQQLEEHDRILEETQAELHELIKLYNEVLNNENDK